MVRRSPTAFEGGYMFYHNIAKNILLVFQLGDIKNANTANLLYYIITAN